MKSYKELTVWQKAIDLVEIIYMVTNKLPREEAYNLKSQMRRSAISIPSNIAEGYRRNTRGEYLQFIGIARGSAAELETQVLICQKLYKETDFDSAFRQLEEVQKMLSGLNTSLNTKPLNTRP